MNQTKKRLSIINLAISITDIETIQLQILKLRLLKSDHKIQEIIAALQDESYAQAQALIGTYIETPNNEILQRTFQNEREKIAAQEQEIIDEFDLFHVKEKEEKQENQIIELDDMLKLAEEHTENTQTKTVEEVDFDALLNIQKEDVMPNNIEIDISEDGKQDFWQEEVHAIQEEDEKRDSFFDLQNEDEEKDEPEEDEEIFHHIEISQDEIAKMIELPETETQPTAPSEAVAEPAEQTPPSEEIVQEDVSAEASVEKDAFMFETSTAIPETEEEDDFFSEVTTKEGGESEGEQVEDHIAPLEEEHKDENEIAVNETEENTSQSSDEEETGFYKAIPYIEQKFKNMQVQYPLTEEPTESLESVNAWLIQISNRGYTETDIGNMMEKINALKETNPSEAAQLLLISAATESKYAHFQLARALFKGEILERNLPESFTLINRLAMNDNYPEAICDLAQFYEHGVGITKDRQKAEVLYEEAMELGIKRAEAHFKRVHKQNRGFLSFLTK